MFTGIVKAIGRIAEITPRDGDVEMRIEAEALGLTDVAIGDSISVSGCCLTVTRVDQHGFVADISRETLRVTTLGRWRVDHRVNLEKAVYAGQPLGGHYVTGHVDAVGSVASCSGDARSQCLEFDVPEQLARYIAPKGSICIDGVSLTVNEVQGSRFTINVIPHTLEATTLGEYRVGRFVNLEVDIIARYLERLLDARSLSGRSP